MVSELDKVMCSAALAISASRLSSPFAFPSIARKVAKSGKTLSSGKPTLAKLPGMVVCPNHFFGRGVGER